jgi:cell division septum initiation protein DivIVA
MKHSTAIAERSWTKAEELAWLETAIEDLGCYSYLGPWLKEYRTDLIVQIQTDVPISAPMPAEAARQAIAILADAREEAKRITADAQATALRMREAMAAELARTRETERRSLQRLVDSL